MLLFFMSLETMKKPIVTENKTCYVCKFGSLTPILSLGDLYVSNFIDDGALHRQQKLPLELVLCNKREGGCGLLQLRHSVSHELMYRKYWYRSGVNKTMTKELQGIVKTIEAMVKLNKDDFVIDIGSNDSTLLRAYSQNELKRIGFEPARNLMSYAKQGTTKIFNEFFNFSDWNKAFGKTKAKVITAIAMFYDLEDPNTFVSHIAKCLDDDGIFIIQMAYLPSMLSKNAFDNICHEHVQYYSLLSLEHLLLRHKLEVFDVILNDINGGSYRTYIRHTGKGKNIKVPNGASKRVRDLRSFEKKLGLDERKIYDDFVKRIIDLRDKLNIFVKKEVEKGKKIYVYGASTKGNTLLQFYNLTNKLIPAAAERNPEKWGKLTIGTSIPIISEEQARAERPDYFLVLPWHFLKEFKEREKEFLLAGGKLIVPLPKFRVIGKTKR